MEEREESHYAIEDAEQRVIHYASSLSEAARWLADDATLEVWDVTRDRRVTSEAMALLRTTRASLPESD